MFTVHLGIENNIEEKVGGVKDFGPLAPLVNYDACHAARVLDFNRCILSSGTKVQLGTRVIGEKDFLSSGGQ